MDSTGQGYTQVTRRLGLFTATAIVVANMIGTGIFTTSGLMAAALPGPGWVLFCWLFGGLIAIAGALCYAELATRMPEEGGEYVYLRELYHPVLGFLTGWTSFFVGFSAPIAGSALAFVAYFSAGFSRYLPDADPSHVLVVEKGVAVSIIVIFTCLHYIGVRAGTGVQNVLTVIKVIILVGLTSAGLLLGAGSWEHLSARVAAPSGGLAFGTAMMLVMFAYSGWNASAYIAGELKDPRRTLPRSLVTGTVIVIALYLAVNLFVFRSVPFEELRGTIPVVEAAAVRAFGEWMGAALSVMIGIALLSSLSAFLMIGPRVYFAMALDRLFFPFAARVHPRSGVPGRSILIQGGLAVIMVLVGSFEQLLIYIGFALGIFPWLAVAGVFLARRRGIGDERAAKVRGYPIVPIFFLASSLALMLVAYINRPVESTAAIVTVAAGVPCYFLWIRRVGRSRKIMSIVLLCAAVMPVAPRAHAAASAWAENGELAVLIEGWNTGWDRWGQKDAYDFVTPLSPGVRYRARVYADMPYTDWERTPGLYEISDAEVDRETHLVMKLAPGGGQAISIAPEMDQ